MKKRVSKTNETMQKPAWRKTKIRRLAKKLPFRSFGVAVDCRRLIDDCEYDQRTKRQDTLFIYTRQFNRTIRFMYMYILRIL
jgi:hypothetical protein